MNFLKILLIDYFFLAEILDNFVTVFTHRTTMLVDGSWGLISFNFILQQKITKSKTYSSLLTLTHPYSSIDWT